MHKLTKKATCISAILVLIFLMTAVAGCGSSGKSEMSGSAAMDGAAPAAAPVYEESQANAGYGRNTRSSFSSIGDDTKAADAADLIGSSVALTADVSNAILAERKVIRNAYISIETDNFDDAYLKINNLILGVGYVQSASINTEKVYVDNELKTIKSGTIIIRVDRSLFDKTFNEIRGIGDVVDWSLNSEDVTGKYIDIESRLRLLKIEESKIEEYLKRLTDLDQILKAESKLTEIRYQIETLTGNLNKLSSLVELSTITIRISEKYPGSRTAPIKVTYGQRLLNSLKNSLKGVAVFLGELVINIVSILPSLILIAIVILIILFIYRKAAKKQRSRRESYTVPDKVRDKGTVYEAENKTEHKDNNPEDKK